VKLVLDMNLPPSWVEFLSGHGFEALHWSSVGDGRATDSEIMQWALDNEYVVFTHDLDFTTLLAVSDAKGPSIVQLRSQDVLADAVGDQVVAVLKKHEDALRSGSIVTVDMVSSRVRLLPIQRPT